MAAESFILCAMYYVRLDERILYSRVSKPKYKEKKKVFCEFFDDEKTKRVVPRLYHHSRVSFFVLLPFFFERH